MIIYPNILFLRSIWCKFTKILVSFAEVGRPHEGVAAPGTPSVFFQPHINQNDVPDIHNLDMFSQNLTRIATMVILSHYYYQ